VLLTGFVDNKDLPRGVPPGDGGGYFIVKNSWGCDFGDQGYAYLPYSWVKKWGNEMIAVTGVS
jgi:C1A family cysteine protease